MKEDQTLVVPPFDRKKALRILRAQQKKQLKSHPAAIAYAELPDRDDNGIQNVPNRNQLLPYLNQLSKEAAYRLLHEDDDEFCTIVETGKQIGLEVKFSEPNAYGGCQMIQLGEKIGLCIWLNGCSAQSAFGFLVIS